MHHSDTELAEKNFAVFSSATEISLANVIFRKNCYEFFKCFWDTKSQIQSDILTQFQLLPSSRMPKKWNSRNIIMHILNFIQEVLKLTIDVHYLLLIVRYLIISGLKWVKSRINAQFFSPHMHLLDNKIHGFSKVSTLFQINWKYGAVDINHRVINIRTELY